MTFVSRVLTREFGMQLAAAARLAKRAREEPMPLDRGRIVLGRAADRSVTLLLHRDPFLVSAAAALSSSLAFEGRMRAGRKQPPRHGSRAIVRARRRRVNVGMLRLALGRPLQRRLACAGYAGRGGPLALAARLADAGVSFVVAGEIAEVAHGAGPSEQAGPEAPRLVLCYDSSPLNVERLLSVLRAAHAGPRGVDLPVGPLTFATIRTVCGLSLRTTHGDVDLIDALPGVGAYRAAVEASVTLDLLGTRCAVLTLPALIAVRLKTRLPSDAQRLVELEALTALPEVGRPTGRHRPR